MYVQRGGERGSEEERSADRGWPEMTRMRDASGKNPPSPRNDT